MSKHSRPVDKAKPAAKKPKPKRRVNGSGAKASRTIINRDGSGRWPFPESKS